MLNRHIQRIKHALSPAKDKISKMAIFGSFLDNPENANDIDVVIWVNKNDYSTVKEIIKKNNQKIFIETYQCRYDIFPDEDVIEDDKTDEIPPIHITSLPLDQKEYQKTSLWVLNKDNFLFI